MRTGWVIAVAAGMWALGTVASTQDDHQRGLQAFRRGDVAGAMTALRPAANAGHAPSQRLLGFILEGADFPEEAALLYGRAAAQADPQAHAALGRMRLAGRGVAKDENEAVHHFSKAAALGDAGSANLLADAWLAGRWGLDAQADPGGARDALRRAADHGHLPAVDALADAYAQGRLGLATDAAEAQRWRDRARQLRQQRAAPAPVATR